MAGRLKTVDKSYIDKLDARKHPDVSLSKTLQEFMIDYNRGLFMMFYILQY